MGTLKFTILILVVLLSFFGCKKKPLSPPVEQYQNLVNIRVVPAYTRLDSQNVRLFSDTLSSAGAFLWQKNIAYKIAFEKNIPTWDPDLLDDIIIYRI